MKNIQVKNKLNRDEFSMTTIKVDDIEVPLSEKELESLISQLYYARPDIFENLADVSEEEIEINTLRESLSIAEEKIEKLEDELFYSKDSDEEDD